MSKLIMDSGPPLNLSTTVKVEDSMITENVLHPETVFTVDGVVVPENTKHVDRETTEEVNLPTERDSDPLTIDHENPTDKTELKTNGLVADRDVSSSVSSKDEATPSSSSSSNREYMCDECGKCFSRASQLRPHQRSHHEEQVSVCKYIIQVSMEKIFIMVSQISIF